MLGSLCEDYQKCFAKKPQNPMTVNQGILVRQKMECSLAGAIRTDPVPISDVTGGERDSITVMGQVVEISWRQAQSGDITGHCF